MTDYGRMSLHVIRAPDASGAAVYEEIDMEIASFEAQGGELLKKYIGDTYALHEGTPDTGVLPVYALHLFAIKSLEPPGGTSFDVNWNDGTNDNTQSIPPGGIVVIPAATLNSYFSVLSGIYLARIATLSRVT
jgi:hypothetical protein